MEQRGAHPLARQYIAWPTKNATNAVTNEMTSVTAVNTIALAA